MVENLPGLFLWVVMERTLGIFLYHLPPYSLSFSWGAGRVGRVFAAIEASGLSCLSPSAGLRACMATHTFYIPPALMQAPTDP